jgi:predicted DNA-binding ribbon-helix-helix protein
MRGKRGGSTSPQQRFVRIRLEPIIWEALHDIAAQQERSVQELVAEIASDAVNLAIHVYIEEFYKVDGGKNGDSGPEPQRTCG